MWGLTKILYKFNVKTNQMSNNITITASSELVVGKTLPEILMVIDLSIHLDFFNIISLFKFTSTWY